MSVMRIGAALVCASLSASCGSAGDWGPYYPEPFGNYNYITNGNLANGKSANSNQSTSSLINLCVNGNEQQVTNVGLTPLFRGAVGFRPNPIIDICNIEAYQRIQNNYLRIFAEMSMAGTAFRVIKSEYGTPSDKLEELYVNADSKDVFWREVTKNGFNYIDGVCQDYLRQLYRLKKNTKGLKRIAVNSGYTTQQIVGNTLIGSTDAGKILAIIASAFGLGATVFDIYEDSVLITADYSAVYGMVRLLQGHLLTKVQSDVTERSDAVKLIQNYLFVCTPQAIESAINLKIGNEGEAELLKAMGVDPVSSDEIKGIQKLIEATLAKNKEMKFELKPGNVIILSPTKN